MKSKNKKEMQMWTGIGLSAVIGFSAGIIFGLLFAVVFFWIVFRMEKKEKAPSGAKN